MSLNVFRKMNIICGYNEVVNILGVHHKSGLFWGVISLHFRAFSYGQGTELEYFGGLLTFKHFWGYS